jgi:hypothetical protein
VCCLALAGVVALSLAVVVEVVVVAMEVHLLPVEVHFLRLPLDQEVYFLRVHSLPVVLDQVASISLRSWHRLVPILVAMDLCLKQRPDQCVPLDGIDVLN